MGYASWNQPRAETELRSLFAGQWANGLVPHIVFTEGDGRYFPGPEFWQVERSPDAPRTSGPPGSRNRRFMRRQRGRLFDRRATATAGSPPCGPAPKLGAWHAYLYRERTRDGVGWSRSGTRGESGMDNSPLWDEALARIELTADQVPEYRRVDVELANPRATD